MEDDDCDFVDLCDVEDDEERASNAPPRHRLAGRSAAAMDDGVEMLDLSRGDVDESGPSALLSASAGGSGVARSKSQSGGSRAVSRAASGVAASAARHSRLDPAEKARRAEERSAARIAKQREKAEAKLQAKQAKMAALIAGRAARGGLAKVEIGISLESTFAASAEGREIADGLEGGDDDGKNVYQVLPPTLTDITNGIFWRRRKLDATAVDPGRLRRQTSGASASAGGAGSAAAGGAGARSAASASSAASAGAAGGLHDGDFLDAAGTLEPFLVLFWRGVTYVDTLLARGTDAIEDALNAMRERLPVGTRITFLVQGAKNYLSKMSERAGSARRAAADAGVGSGAGAGTVLPTITLDGYEAANAHLYVTCDLQIKETHDIGESLSFLRQYTRAIAEFPYRMQPSALAVVAKKMGLSKAARMVEDAGVTDPDMLRLHEASTTWLAMLQVLPNMSLSRARNVQAVYPTFRSLVDVYRDPSITTAVKERLLETILEKGRRQTALSKAVYRFLTTYNPDDLIGSGT